MLNRLSEQQSIADKQTSQICTKYPSYLNSNNLKKVVSIQRMLRAKKPYVELGTATKCGSLSTSALVSKTNSFNHQRFKQLSENNIKRLKHELGQLLQEEKDFLIALLEANPEITHYTNSADKIFNTGSILSYNYLEKKFGAKHFNHMSQADAKELGNGGFVFFRYELKHQNQDSRFGDEQIIIESDSTSLFETGWISLYEMKNPFSTSIVQTIKSADGTPLRTIGFNEDYEKTGKFNYKYGEKEYEFDMVGTVFYGPDIKRGIALAAIQELRRIAFSRNDDIGIKFRNACLSNLSIHALNIVLAKLFRVEAKIPSLVQLEHVKFSYSAPNIMVKAIASGDIHAVNKLLKMKGIKIDAAIKSDKSALFYACTINNETAFHIVKFLHENGADLRSNTTTAAHIAAENGNIKCLFYCLNHGINLEERDKKSKTVREYAEANEEIKKHEFLLQTDKIPTFDNLCQLIRSGQQDELELIFNRFPEKVTEWLQGRDHPNGDTLMHIAAKSGHLAIVTYLNKNGASYTCKNNIGRSPVNELEGYSSDAIRNYLSAIFPYNLRLKQLMSDFGRELLIQMIKRHIHGIQNFLQNLPGPQCVEYLRLLDKDGLVEHIRTGKELADIINTIRYNFVTHHQFSLFTNSSGNEIALFLSDFSKKLTDEELSKYNDDPNIFETLLKYRKSNQATNNGITPTIRY